MSLTTILPLLSAILVFLLGIIVLNYGRKEKLNISFALFALVISIWMFGTFMMFLNKNNTGNIIFWDKFVYIGVVFIPVIMLQFGLALTNYKIIKDNFLLIIGYSLSFIFLLLIPSKLFVNGSFIYQWGAHSRAQLFHHFFLVYFSAYIILWFIIVLKYFNLIESSLEREKIKYSFLAFIILAIFGSLGFLPAYGISVYPFGYISGAVFVIILAYAIVVHRLMDIKLVMRKYFVYFLSLISILLPAFLLKNFAASLFPDFNSWLDLFILILSLSLFPPLKTYYYKIANKYFFSSLYDSKEVISKLSENLSSTLEAHKIYGFISSLLTGAFHVKMLGILVYDEKKEEYKVVHNVGLNIGNKRRFKSDPKLQAAYADRSDPIIVEELKSAAYEEFKETIDLLTSLGVEMLVPLDIKKRPIGLIVLGAKESGDMYNNDDLQVLKVVGAQTAVALENALLYGESKNFNLKLKKEVAIATADLKAANEQLKKLDEAKSEFISIASHQLRTPLTAIKGYISMMLEGDFGQLTQQEHVSLEKVFESNERLIRLVEDLLNISRIESGRLQFSFAAGSLEKMVDGVVEELSGNAKKKGLNLVYNKPQAALPLVTMDEDKLRQVVMNLVDNSIKYTKQGTVTVSLDLKTEKVKDDKQKEIERKYLEFCVADTGMGISKEDLPNLFQKFSRGTGTSLIHTEGTGLGLYVARMMMEAHKGAIWAESEGEDKGSKFCFKLPIDNK